MPLLPAHLPPWAYLAAGVAAFGAARVLTHGSAAGPVDPTAAASSSAPAAASSSAPAGGGGLWDTFGDQSAQFGPGGSLGVLNGAGTGTGFSSSDALGGQLTPPLPLHTPTPTPSTSTASPSGYTMHIAAGARVTTFTIDSNGQITSASVGAAWRSGSHAPASALVRRHTAPSYPGNQATVSTTRVLAGAYAGKVVRLDSGVTLSSP